MGSQLESRLFGRRPGLLHRPVNLPRLASKLLHAALVVADSRDQAFLDDAVITAAIADAAGAEDELGGGLGEAAACRSAASAPIRAPNRPAPSITTMGCCA